MIKKIDVKHPPLFLSPAMGDGKTDDTKAIQNIINSGAKEIIFPVGVYNISGTINVPDCVDLKLSGDSFTWKSSDKAAVLKLISNVDMFLIGSDVSIRGGILDARSVSDFSKSLVKIDYSGNKEISGGKVDSVLLSNDFKGNGVEFCASTPGTGSVFPFYISGMFQGFKKGIFSHKKDLNFPNWFSGLFIEASIVNCEMSIDLSFGGNGGKISGSCQPLVTSREKIGSNNNPLMRINSSHMIIDCMIWDINTAVNKFALENNGQNNILYGNLALEDRFIVDTSKSPRNLKRVGTHNEYSGTPSNSSYINKENMNGYQDNLLLGAHKKFTIKKDLHNTIMGGGGSGLTLDGMFLDGEESSHILLKDSTKDGYAEIEILLDRPRSIKYVGLRFTDRPYRCKIELYSENTKSYISIVDELANDRFLQSGGIDMTFSWQYNHLIDHEFFGGMWERKISKMRYTIYLSQSSPYGGKFSCNPAVAFAYDGSLSFIPPYGGKLYGDMEFNNSADSVVLKSPDGTKYKLTVGNGGELSTTAIL